jgi:MFS family permease
LIGALKAPFAMVVDAVSYLVSAVFLFWIRRPEPPVEPHVEAVHGPKPSMRSEMAAGLRYVGGHRWLRSIAATTGTSNFFGNVIASILVLYLVDERGLGPAAIGFAFSLGSVGVLMAAFTTSAITRRVGVGPMLVAMAMLFSISGLFLAFAPDDLIWWGLAISSFLGGFAGVAWNINQVSLRQAITPPRMLGRMNATMRLIVWGTIPIGAILGGALATVIGLHATIVVGALGGLVAFIPVTLSSVRRITTMPLPVEDVDGGGATV